VAPFWVQGLNVVFGPLGLSDRRHLLAFVGEEFSKVGGGDDPHESIALFLRHRYDLLTKADHYYLEDDSHSQKSHGRGFLSDGRSSNIAPQ